MMRIKVSVRFVLILTACIAVAMWRIGPLAGPAVQHTSRQFDVAVVGPGYLRVLDRDASEPRFTRTGRLELDCDRVLNIEIAGELYPIDPTITVPPDVKRIIITNDGYVRAGAPAGPQTLGRFQLSLFRAGSQFDNPWSSNAATDRSGSEKPFDPSRGVGSLQQGYLERSPPAVRVILAVFALAILASVLLNIGIGSGYKMLRATSLRFFW